MKKSNKAYPTSQESPAQQPPKGSGYMHPKSEMMDHEKLNDKMAKGLGC